MKYSLPGVVGAALILLAGCSSKSAVSTNDSVPTVKEPVAAAVTTNNTADGVRVEDRSASNVLGPVMGDIFFDFDSAALSAESEEQLKQNATWMHNHALVNVTVEGHCDARGTDEYNMALGQRRADAARDYLVRIGVSAGRLSTVSFGKEKPFDQANSEEAWAKNRRDHFVTK